MTPFLDFVGVPNSEAPLSGPLTVGASASTLRNLLGGTINPYTRFIEIAVEDAAIRIDPTGGTPTSTKGVNFAAGTVFRLSRPQAAATTLVRASGADAKIQVLQYSA